MNALNQQKALTTVQRISLVKDDEKVRKREREGEKGSAGFTNQKFK